MKRFFFEIIFVLITLYFFSCTNQTSSNNDILKNNDSTGIWPMRVGNVWIYSITIYDSNNVVTGQWYDTLRIIRDTILGTEKAYILESSHARLSYASPKPYYVRTDGVYADPDGYGTISLLIKYPAMMNEMYLKTINSCDTTTISSLSQTISTKAGNFNCIKYFRKVHIDNNIYRFSLETCFAVGFGKVREIYREIPGEPYHGKKVTELIEYHLIK